MPERDTIDSESTEEASSHNSSSDEEEGADSGDRKVRNGGASASDYEKQRQSRIAENRARMEALGLRKLASSLMAGSSQGSTNKKSKVKKAKVADDDDDDVDYRPEDERRPSSSSDEDENDNEDDDGGDFEGFLGAKSNKRKSCASKKVKNAASNPKKKASIKNVCTNSDYIDDDDALNMAIALSLQESGLSSSDMVTANANETAKGGKQAQDDSGKIKRKKPFTSRLQMSEDELILHFYQFDENWNDGISVRDLERVAIAHDFTWTDKELADMIRCFDSDDDGKLSLDDFRKIAMRCKMIGGFEGQ